MLGTSFFATAQVFAVVKHAATLPSYRESRLAQVAVALWCFVACNAGFWCVDDACLICI